MTQKKPRNEAPQTKTGQAMAQTASQTHTTENGHGGNDGLAVVPASQTDTQQGVGGLYQIVDGQRVLLHRSQTP